MYHKYAYTSRRTLQCKFCHREIPWPPEGDRVLVTGNAAVEHRAYIDGREWIFKATDDERYLEPFKVRFPEQF